IDDRGAIGGLASADADLLRVRILGPAMAVGALVLLGNRLAAFVFRPLENCLAALLRRSGLTIGQTVTIRAVGERVNKRHKIDELLRRVTLRSIEEFLRARATFGGHIGIAPVPLERFRARQALQRSIVDNVLAEAVGLEVPLQAVNGRIEMAVGAAELALKCVVSGEEKLLAAAKCVDDSRSAEIDG